MKTTKSPEDARFIQLLEKARRFCAFRERSAAETKVKLLQSGAGKEEVEKVLEQLKEEGFLNDFRFASAFARGKFNQNQWGKEKIARELAAHGVTSEASREAFREIDNDIYIETLQNIVRKKLETLKGEPDFIRRGKTVEFCLRKGFELNLILQVVDSLLNIKTP